ncbi:hypothetical protein [Demequina salsinemoris]|uniref:hypothetical protein n=1 Tax=Demequina salsinemoris TaxID=577470 RepID=UPI000785FF22|nr:hypothetical protein [Demequina salsinemoris]
MFGRRKRASEPQPFQQDPEITFLSTVEADRLRAMVVRHFAQGGVPVALQPGAVAAPDGRVFGLWNLAVACAQTSPNPADWEPVVASHVQTLLNPPPAAADLSDEDMLSIVHSRLVPAAALSEQGTPLTAEHARPVAEGVIEVLALDFPDTVQMLGGDALAGRDVDALWAAGRARTLAVPIEDREDVEVQGGGVLTLLSSESYFFAGRILDMPSLLMEVYGPRALPRGVVVGVPHRHAIVLHAVDGMRSVQAISSAAQFVARSASGAAGALSPHLYWWDGATLHTISRPNGQGGVAVEARGAFGDMVGSLQ